MPWALERGLQGSKNKFSDAPACSREKSAKKRLEKKLSFFFAPFDALSSYTHRPPLALWFGRNWFLSRKYFPTNYFGKEGGGLNPSPRRSFARSAPLRGILGRFIVTLIFWEGVLPPLALGYPVDRFGDRGRGAMLSKESVRLEPAQTSSHACISYRIPSSFGSKQPT